MIEHAQVERLVEVLNHQLADRHQVVELARHDQPDQLARLVDTLRSLRNHLIRGERRAVDLSPDEQVVAEFLEVLARSSLGTVAAQGIRRQTSPETVSAVLTRAGRPNPGGDSGRRVEPRGFAALLGRRRFGVLTELGVARRYQRGESLVRQGDPGGYLLVLTEGRVRVNALAADGAELLRATDGAELLLALRAPGDLITETGARRSVSVRALETVTARYVTEEEFQRFLAKQHAEGALRDYLLSNLSDTVPYQSRLAHFPPLRRVARLLLEVIALAEPGDRAVPFTHAELARCLGMARSALVEQLKLLRSDGALTPNGPLAVADVKALSRHAGIDL